MYIYNMYLYMCIHTHTPANLLTALLVLGSSSLTCLSALKPILFHFSTAKFVIPSL